MNELWAQWAMAILAFFTALSSFLSWMTRQQMQMNKLELDARLAALELRLSDKFGAGSPTWQAHNDLAQRVQRLEDRTQGIK